jgi:hypothetical protein
MMTTAAAAIPILPRAVRICFLLFLKLVILAVDETRLLIFLKCLPADVPIRAESAWPMQPAHSFPGKKLAPLHSSPPAEASAVRQSPDRT